MTTKRQEEIIKKSIKIIATKGIQGLTIKNLSKEIGISEPAIYRHFESKTDIILAILDNFLELSREINDWVKTQGNNALSKIELMFRKIVEVYKREPETIVVIFSEELFKNDPVFVQKINEVIEEKLEAVESIILDGQQKGEIRDDIPALQLAKIVTGALRFKVKYFDLKGKHAELEGEIDEFIYSVKKILSK